MYPVFRESSPSNWERVGQTTDPGQWQALMGQYCAREPGKGVTYQVRNTAGEVECELKIRERE